MPNGIASAVARPIVKYFDFIEPPQS